MISIVVMIFHFVELIKLQMEHKSFIVNVSTWFSTGASTIKQLADQVRIRLISQSQLNNGIPFQLIYLNF